MNLRTAHRTNRSRYGILSAALLGPCIALLSAGATAGIAADVTIVEDFSYPQGGNFDYGLAPSDITLDSGEPGRETPVTIMVQIHNYGLCSVNSGWGHYSSSGRSAWGEWDFVYDPPDTRDPELVDITYRCFDKDATVDWRVELDGVHVQDISVPPCSTPQSWNLVTLHDVPLTAGPHTLFLGTYQMDLLPDYNLDWITVDDIRIEAESYDRMGGNDSNPDLRGLRIFPRGANPPESMNLTVQVWLGDPAAGGELLAEQFVGPTNEVIDSGHDYAETTYTAHYIESEALASLEVPWTPPAPGNYDIYVVIDPHGVMTEIDEENNVAVATLVVGDPEPDCNDNGIPDECDIDCGEPGGPCDVPGCGQSADCQPNGIPDECDIAAGTSQDLNGNGVPDECETAPGWVQNPGNGHWYTLTPEPLYWELAQALAETWGGHLVTISDSDEQTFLTATFTQYDLWIGLYQIIGSPEPSGGWVWVTGEPVTFTNWGTGEPNQHRSRPEDFAEMNQATPGKWNDTSNNMERGIVECETAPVMGACCNDDVYSCTDGVWPEECAGRFQPGVTCEDAPFDPPCGAYHVCTHTITMWDSGGDGWNGGYVDLDINGAFVLHGLNEPGGSGPRTGQFPASSGDEIATDWHAGSSPEECSYCIYDGDGAELGCDGMDGTAPVGIAVTGHCTLDCNANGIPDECDINCGAPGGPCDVPGCGQSSDFNGNGIPDECDGLGDLNCDGVCDYDDIDFFVFALQDPIAYRIAYPECDFMRADVNGDGAVNYGDLDPFVALLAWGGGGS